MPPTIDTIAAMALARLCLRLGGNVEGDDEASRFLRSHEKAIAEAAVKAVRQVCLTLEIALGTSSRWQPLLQHLHDANQDLHRTQLHALWESFGQRPGAAPGENVAIARCLRLLRQRNGRDADRPLMLAEIPTASAEFGTLDRLTQELEQNEFAPLASLLRSAMRYGDSLVVDLIDFFLSRLLLIDPRTNGGFIFVHLDALEDLWPDDIVSLARLVGDYTKEIETFLDTESRPEATDAPSSDEDALERHFQAGLNSYLAADYVKAIAQFTEALRVAPESFPLRSYRGDAHRLLCNYDAAIADYSAALKVNVRNAPVLSQRATAYSQKGAYREAIEDATAALAIDAAYASAMVVRADANAALGWHEQAICDYTQASELQPQNLWAFFGRAKVHLVQRAFGSVIADCDRVLALNPNYVPALLLRAEARREQGKFAPAILDYTEVLRLHPRNQAAYRGRAQAFERKGDLDSAVNDYSLALHLDATDVLCLCKRGNLFRRKRDLARALGDLNDAIRHGPDRACAHYYRGLVFLAKGKHARALDDTKKALECDPTMTKAHLAHALIADFLGQHIDSIRHCGRALQLGGHAAAAHLVRGVVCAHAGHAARAIADLSEAIRLDGTLPLAFQERASASLAVQDHAAAMADLTTLIELDSSQACAYAMRGAVHQLRGNHDAAMADFAAALKRDPKALLAGWSQSQTDDVRGRALQTIIDYLEGDRAARINGEETKRSKPAARAVPRKSAKTMVHAAVNSQTAPPLPAAETQTHKTRDAITQTMPADVEVLEDAPEAADVVEPERNVVTPATAPIPPFPSTEEARSEGKAAQAPTQQAADEILEIPDAVVEEEASEILAQDSPQEATASAPSPSTHAPVMCPMCRTSADPSEETSDGRIRCGNCKTMFVPAGASAPKFDTLPKKTLPKAKSTQKKRDEAEWEFSLAQKMIMSASVLVILSLAAYFFMPRFGSAGDEGLPVLAKVTANDLLREYSTNRTQAAKKFGSGPIIVTGEVTDIFTDKKPRVRFRAADKSNVFVEAVFSHPNELKTIEKAKTISVRGECEGWQNRIVELSLCKVVPTEAKIP